ncbi:hypothetical protein PORY_002253 [Pneumocystis oryctolagi]|uniref:Uncharacterized protein n=1 Tax=Pneumocystis oryctolagi TaxID=42067 RepID=A0ACB7CBG2_9ASCO|nr:hypothetical protein PORY_002253 [Pneumocystis oryctolagi]
MSNIYQDEENFLEKTSSQDLKSRQTSNKTCVKTERKETIRKSLYDSERNVPFVASQANLRVSSGNIKKTISAFEQMLFTKTSPNRNTEDLGRKVQDSGSAQFSPVLKSNEQYPFGFEKKVGNIEKMGYGVTEQIKVHTEDVFSGGEPEGRVTKEVLSSCASLQKGVLNKSTKSLPERSLTLSGEKIGNAEEKIFIKKTPDKLINDKSLSGKLFEYQGDESNIFNPNDSSSFCGNSLDSDLIYEMNDLKDQLVAMIQEKSDMEKTFNEKYSKLVEENNDLEKKNQNQEEIIDMLNKQIESQKLISESKDYNKYIEHIDFLTQRVKKLESDLDELNTSKQELLKDLDTCQIENKKSTEILKSEIEKSKSIIKDLEEKSKINTDNLDLNEYFQSVKSDYIKKEEILKNEIDFMKQVMEEEKNKSIENIQKMKEEVKISNSLRKKMGIELSDALLRNNNLSQELDNFKNSFEVIKNNYEKALEKEFKEKNDLCLENLRYVKKTNAKLETITDELENEKKKLKEKTKQYNKLYSEFSEFKSKHSDFRKKTLTENEQTAKHISKVKEEHESILKSLLEEHNMIIEKLNIQQDILSNYVNIIKEKDEIIENYKQDFENMYFNYLGETDDIHSGIDSKDIFVTN